MSRTYLGLGSREREESLRYTVPYLPGASDRRLPVPDWSLLLRQQAQLEAPGVHLIVERVSNGAVTENEADWDESVKVRKAYEFDTDDGDLDGLMELLYDILDGMGWSGSRYSEKRVRVVIVHGDKFEHSSGERCDLCQ